VANESIATVQAAEVRAAERPTLSMRGISKRYDAIAALTDVSFDVLPGEVHALLGENGAGKSTLMNVASGATTADARSKAAELQAELRCAVTPVLCAGDRTFRTDGVLVAARGELAEAIRSVPPQRRLAPERLSQFGHSLKV